MKKAIAADFTMLMTAFIDVTSGGTVTAGSSSPVS
jgi:hypothetical protein